MGDLPAAFSFQASVDASTSSFEQDSVVQWHVSRGIGPAISKAPPITRLYNLPGRCKLGQQVDSVERPSIWCGRAIRLLGIEAFGRGMRCRMPNTISPPIAMRVIPVVIAGPRMLAGVSPVRKGTVVTAAAAMSTPAEAIVVPSGAMTLVAGAGFEPTTSGL